MADISKIKIGSATYDVKDTVAREGLSTKISANTPTINGMVKILGATIDIQSSSAATNTLMNFMDMNDKFIGQLKVNHTDTGTNMVNIGATNNMDGSNHYNHLKLGLDSNNNPIVAVDSASAWRQALGADSNGCWPVSLGGTGGPVAGIQTIENTSVYDGAIYMNKWGIFTYIRLYGIKLKTALTTSAVQLCTLQEGFRPGFTLYLPCTGSTPGTYISITSQGVVTLFRGAIASEVPANTAINLFAWFNQVN